MLSITKRETTSYHKGIDSMKTSKVSFPNKNQKYWVKKLCHNLEVRATNKELIKNLAIPNTRWQQISFRNISPKAKPKSKKMSNPEDPRLNPSQVSFKSSMNETRSRRRLKMKMPVLSQRLSSMHSRLLHLNNQQLFSKTSISVYWMNTIPSAKKTKKWRKK